LPSEASSALRLPSCAFALNARYCSIMLSHSSSVLPVLRLISAFAFSISSADFLPVPLDAGAFFVVPSALGALGLRGALAGLSSTALSNFSTIARNLARASSLNYISFALCLNLASCSADGLFVSDIILCFDINFNLN